MLLRVVEKTEVPNVYIAQDASLPLDDSRNHPRFLFSLGRPVVGRDGKQTLEKLVFDETYSCLPCHKWISANVQTIFGAGLPVQAIC